MKEPGPIYWAAYAAYSAAIPTILTDEEAVVVGKTGGSYKYRFATLPVVRDALVKALALHGLVVSQIAFIENGYVMLRSMLIHVASGEGVQSVTIVGSVDLPPQLMGSAMSFARRYGMGLVGLLVAEDDDDAARATPRSAPPAPRKAPAKIIEPAEGEARLRKAIDKAGTVAALDDLIRHTKTQELLNNVLDAVERAALMSYAAARKAALASPPAAGKPKGPVQTKPKERSMAQRAGTLCQRPAFWKFVTEQKGVQIFDAEGAALFVRDQCGVTSRADLDGDPVATSAFRSLESEFNGWMHPTT